MNNYFPVDKIETNWPEAICSTIVVIAFIIFMGYAIKHSSKD